MARSLYSVGKSMDTAGLWKGRRLLLQQIDIELTERCNNNCVHCLINQPANDPKVRDRELSTEAVKRLLDESADLGCLTAQLTGGEPLLRQDFKEIYQHARRLGMRVRLFTNGTLITPDIAGLFACIPPLEAVVISVYGMSRDAYEGVTRVKGSHVAVWRGIRELEKRGVPYTLRGVYLPQNRDELESFDHHCMNLPSMGRRPGMVTQLDLRCRHDSNKKNSRIQALRTQPEDVVHVLTRGGGPEFRESMRTFYDKYMGASDSRLFSCGAGLGRCHLDAYGMIQPCVAVRHPDAVFDSANVSLRETMTRGFPELRKMSAESPEYLEKCAQCFIRGLCEQCPGKSWTEHGTLDTPVKYYCDVAHAFARFLGLIEGGEEAWRVRDGNERVQKMVSQETRND